MSEEQATWVIAGHNGIEVNAEAGESWINADETRNLRTVSKETDGVYIEFAVDRRAAKLLRDYLNAQDATITELRKQLSHLGEMRERDIDSSVDDAETIVNLEERALAAEANLKIATDTLREIATDPSLVTTILRSVAAAALRRIEGAL